MSAPGLPPVYRPCVLSLVCPTVDAFLAKNNVTFTELLKPFGDRLASSPTLGTVAFRSPSSSSSSSSHGSSSSGHSLRGFGLHFVDPPEQIPIPPQGIERILQWTLDSSAPTGTRSFTDGLRSVWDVSSFLKRGGGSEVSLFWYGTFKSQWIEITRNIVRFNPDASVNPHHYHFSLLDHPIHIVIVVSGHDENAPLTVEALRAKFLQETKDLNKTIIVVHNNDWNSTMANAKEKSLETIKKLKQIYGPDSIMKLVEVNSNANGDSKIDDIWFKFILKSRFIQKMPSILASVPAGTDSQFLLNDFPIESLVSLPPGTSRCNYFSPGDLESLNSLLSELLIKHILPSNERRMSQLAEKVSAVRKGFKNAMKSLFSRNKTGGTMGSMLTSSSPQAPLYPVDSPEYQTLLLADLSFLFQDYDFASSHYRMCQSDAKNDKFYSYYAYTQEMLGTSMGMIELKENGVGMVPMSSSSSSSSLREIRECYETAINSYHQLGMHKLATKCTMMAVDIYKCCIGSYNKIQDCISILTRANEKESNSVRSALLLEQIAYLYLHLSPSSVRKYSLYLTLAGHSYHKFNHKMHGVRCFTSASSVYADKGWNKIEEHLYYNLGRDFFQLKQFKESIQMMAEVIGKNKAPPNRTKQTMYYKEFIYIVKTFLQAQLQHQQQSPFAPPIPSPFPLAEVSLPQFINSTIRVYPHPPTGVPSACTVTTWNQVSRSSQRMSLDPSICNKPLFSLSNTLLYKETERNAVVNESIRLWIQMKNPLLIDIPVNKLQLQCKYTTLSNESASSTSSSPPFITPTIDLVLPASSTRDVELSVIPTSTGQLMIESVRWLLNDVVPCVHQLAMDPKVVQVGPKKLEVQIDNALLLPVVDNMPQLSISVERPPTAIFHGEFVATKIKLKNEGKIPLQRLILRVSHPGFLLVGKPKGFEDSSMPSPSSHQPHHYQPPSNCYPYDWSDGMIPLYLQLQPDQTVELPLYIHGTIVGFHLIGLLFRYDPLIPAGSPDPPMKVRLSYLEFPLMIHQLFTVNFFNRPSFQEIEDSLLGIEIGDSAPSFADPLQTRDPIFITRTEIQSKVWKISPLTPSLSTASLFPSTSLGPFESSSSELSLWRLDAYQSIVLLCRITNTAMNNKRRIIGKEEKKEDVPVQKDVVPIATVASLQALPLRSSCVNYHSVEIQTLQTTKFPLQSAPFSCFLSLERNLLIEEEKQAVIVNPSARVADSSSGNKMDITIYWQNSTGSRWGFVQNVGVHCMKPLPSACPLKISVVFPRVLTNNFQSTPKLSVPVKLIIRNTLEFEKVSFLFETLQPDEEFDQTRRAFKVVPLVSTVGKYFWSGVTKRKINDLSSGEIVEFQLDAEFYGEGIFNLNRFKFTVEYAQSQGNTNTQQPKKPRVFFFPIQHLIDIKLPAESAKETVSPPIASSKLQVQKKKIEKIEVKVNEQEEWKSDGTHSPSVSSVIEDALDFLSSNNTTTTGNPMFPVSSTSSTNGGASSTSSLDDLDFLLDGISLNGRPSSTHESASKIDGDQSKNNINTEDIDDPLAFET